MIDPDTVYAFASDLLHVGFEDVEVGHGLGLGAHRSYSAGFTDRELYERLAPLAESNRLYSFFIPYVGNLDDIKMARQNGLYGLRIGMEPAYLKEYMPIVEEAKKLGYFVALNIMKSYTVTPTGFGELAEMVKDVADVLYLVDSAGHILPGEAQNYIKAVHDKVGMIPLGYHGHNNLGLAVASALEVIDEGVEYVDTTLTGIGRSGGNVPTETMIAVLARKFGVTHYSDEFLLRTLKLARSFRDYILAKGKVLDIRSEDILFGYAGFHSSFEGLVRDFADRKGLDFHKAILDVSRKERVFLSKEILDSMIDDLEK